MDISRRRLLTAGAAAAGVAAAAAAAQGDPAATVVDTAAVQTAAQAAGAALPNPADSGIDHIILLMMENRSFDHYLGWLPGADGRQAGLTFTDNNGVSHSTYHLQVFKGCAHPDPDHSFEGGRVEFNNGRNDGWLRAGTNDIFSIGYYNAADLPFLGRAALDWTVCDRYFAAIMAETYPNRIYQHAAQTDRSHRSQTICKLPTIWDRLAAAGVPGRYYFTDVPFTALWGTKHLGITRPYSQFLAQAAAGTLPAVSFVDPKFDGEAVGVSGDEHPHGDIRAGQAFVDQVYEAVVSSPNWARTVLIINYDEWGGFFDHVPPAVAPDANPAWGLRGFRVPCLVVSPLARRGHVAHGVYDHTSVLKLIEWRFGLAPLTPRDAAARNLAEVLNFGQPNLTAPRYHVPPFTAQACTVHVPASSNGAASFGVPGAPLPAAGQAGGGQASGGQAGTGQSGKHGFWHELSSLAGSLGI